MIFFISHRSHLLLIGSSPRIVTPSHFNSRHHLVRVRLRRVRDGRQGGTLLRIVRRALRGEVRRDGHGLRRGRHHAVDSRPVVRVSRVISCGSTEAVLRVTVRDLRLVPVDAGKLLLQLFLFRRGKLAVGRPFVHALLLGVHVRLRLVGGILRRRRVLYGLRGALRCRVSRLLRVVGQLLGLGRYGIQQVRARVIVSLELRPELRARDVACRT